MQANILPFYTPSTPGWGQKVKLFFLKKFMLHIKLKGKSVEHWASKMFDLLHTLDLLGWVEKVRHDKCIFIELSELIG